MNISLRDKSVCKEKLRLINPLGVVGGNRVKESLNINSEGWLYFMCSMSAIFEDQHSSLGLARSSQVNMLRAASKFQVGVPGCI